MSWYLRTHIYGINLFILFFYVIALKQLQENSYYHNVNSVCSNVQKEIKYCYTCRHTCKVAVDVAVQIIECL